MKKLLIYDKALEPTSEYKIITFGTLLNISENISEIQDIQDDLSGYYIDISNVFDRTNLTPLFVERYLDEMFLRFEDITFISSKNNKELILEKLSHFFIIIRDYVYEHSDGSRDVTEKINKLLLPEDKIRLLLNFEPKDQRIFSVSSLIDLNKDNKFEIDKLKSISEIDFVVYFDITGGLELMRLSRENIILFQALFLYVKKTNEKIIFIAKNFNEAEIEKIIPYTFITTNQELEQQGKQEHANSNLLSEDLERELIGHKNFKEDFIEAYGMFVEFQNISSSRILSMFLSGPSGIGKTEFAKILSKSLYPEDDLIKINFGNYNSKDIINTLIGSPKGYIGSEDGGELINKLGKTNSKVILIDEFEKANHDIFNFFYELLEDGAFTDRQGILHNLNGYIIIFTSNLTKEEYNVIISDPLKSRFDMVYYFNHISKQEKISFAKSYFIKVKKNIKKEKEIEIMAELDEEILLDCMKENNLREIKRKIDIFSYKQFLLEKARSDDF